MIGSFWNLCRACPSMPIDKLHSEYRSTYTWHEYTGSNQEHTVVQRGPQPPLTYDTRANLQSTKSIEDENNEGTSLEPPLPRRKKCPELAYRTHEFISTANAVDGGGGGGGGGAGGGGIDALDSNIEAAKVKEITKTLPTSQLSKAITRISTEYRLQFAWPRRQQQLTNGDVASITKDDEVNDQQQQQLPRKSLSMGTLKQGQIVAVPVPVHRKRQVPINDHRRNGAQLSELEPLVGIDVALPDPDEHEELNASDVKLMPKKNATRGVRITEQPLQENKFRKTKERPFSATEVIELRRELKRLADEYKHRDWGGGLVTEDEAMLWKRVSNNHALNALSLARSTSKEEKDKENMRKVTPEGSITGTTVTPAGRPSSVQARLLHGTLLEDSKPDNDKALARARRDYLIRHHLDRTTGTGDIALLPSPTREKLEPAIPRRREDQGEVQPRSKSSPKNSPRSVRSQSVGPSMIDRRSPKRQPQRSSYDVKDSKEKDKDKEMREKSSDRERHPRPSTVSRWKTRDASSRIRSSSESPIKFRRQTHLLAPSKPFLATNAPPHRPAHHAKPGSAFTNANTNDTNSSPAGATAQSRSQSQSLSQSQSCSNTALQNARQASVYSAGANRVPPPPPPAPGSLRTSVHHGSSKQEPANHRANHHPSKPPTSAPLRPSQTGQAMTAEPQVNGQHPHQPGWIDDEPVVKSPPEPTRVKSPEQMIMRSPEPVNWTVPLDTGKTFTVTQNVLEGEPPTRVHSEARSWAGASMVSASLSTPPEMVGINRQQQKLTEHKQNQQNQYSGYKSPESESVSLGSFSGTNGHKDDSLGERDSPVATLSKNELDQDFHCLDKPIFEFESKTNTEVIALPIMKRSTVPITTVPQPTQDSASDLLEKARNRFDKFWSTGKSSD